MLAYLREHLGLFGLEEPDLGTLKLADRYTSRGRVVHLVFRQEFQGITVVNTGLTANVTVDGELVNVFGPVRSDLRVSTVTPHLPARAALQTALRDAGSGDRAPAGNRASGVRRRATNFPDGQEAELVLFADRGAPQLAWRIVSRPGVGQEYKTIVDAHSGDVLQRVSLINDASARVFDHYPGAAVGGTQRTADVSAYVTDATRLNGPYARVFSDVNGDGAVQASEEIPPSSGTDWLYTYTPFNPVAGGNCPPSPVFCSWNHNAGSSWETNRRQSSTQLFYFISHFHDHLRSPGIIDFGPTKGNFEAAGGDPVIGAPLTGANGPGGLPALENTNNAFMSTRPDGFPGYMVSLLAKPQAGTNRAAVNTADDASVIYHEYTHGMSNRLITYSDGWGALSWHHSASMGEAWSDWYAFDALVGEGWLTDTATPGQLVMARYSGGGEFRSEALDCPLGAPPAQCPGSPGAGSGGYTLGDMGKVEEVPETHADGEIWAQTLWDLRRRMIAEFGTANGRDWTRILVTAGMELSPPEPSYLDMRDAILQADNIYFGDADAEVIWEVFAARGMGFFASAIHSADTRPVENFSMPPAPGGPTGTLSGTVTNEDGNPLEDVTVYVGGHFLGNGFDDLVAVTDAAGHYSIIAVPAGTYPQLVAYPGVGRFDHGLATNVPVTGNATTTRNFTLRRDWAGLDGASIVDADGEFEEACPPEFAIDQVPGSSWKTSSPAYAGDPGPEFFTVQLPEVIDVASLEIDPTATSCGNG